MPREAYSSRLSDTHTFWQALVTGSNLILGPETSIYLSNMNFLSPDGQCYSFDHRANGYARGEGLVVLVLKRLQDAIRDSDQIRAVIRASGSNQDGRTPGITQPSMKAQEQLIRDVYKSCNLQFKSTRYVEAHGKRVLNDHHQIRGTDLEISGRNRNPDRRLD